MKIDDPSETVDRLRDFLVRDGAVPHRETATTVAWVTGVTLEGEAHDDFAIRLTYVDLRTQRSEAWVLDRVRAFADATCSHDVDELAQMTWIELEEAISALPGSRDGDV